MLNDYIEIKVVVPTDALPIGYVGRTTFVESWSYLYTAEDIRVYNNEEFNIERIEKDILDKANTFLLASLNGKVAGYSKMRRDRNPKGLEEASTIEIERIYVLKEFQNKKIGRQLMNRCIEIAVSEKHDWLWLGVNEFNTGAINLYKRFGFEVFGTKAFKICNVVDEDLMMRKKL